MNTSPEEQSAILELTFKTAFKSLLNSLPFAGPFLTDVLFEYRSKIKQDRLNHFVELLKDYFEKNNTQANIKSIQTEEFSDLFEDTIRKVLLTRSTTKLIAFRNILVKGIEAKNEIDYCEIFNNILSQLHEIEIIILESHYIHFNKAGFTLTISHNLNRELSNFQSKPLDSEDDILREKEKLQKEQERVNKGLNEKRYIRKRDYYNLDEGQYKYHIQNLYNKGLLYDEGIGSFDTDAFDIMIVTDLGVKFLEFIQTTNKS